AFTACASPFTTPLLADGTHTFQVRAIDGAGNTDPTPSSFTWTIDSTPPRTTFSSTPNAFSNDPIGRFTFTANEGGGTFQCKLDAGSFASCTSPVTTISLADGSHTFTVRATDTAGNVELSPPSFTWTIDTAAPDTTLTGQPSNPSSTPTGTFTFVSSDLSATF